MSAETATLESDRALLDGYRRGERWALERVFALYIAVRENKHALLSGIQKHILKGDIQAAIRFLGEELFFTVDVDGACSFDLEVVHASALPFARPELRAEEVVQYEIFE